MSDALPELLGLLAHELRGPIAELFPDIDAEARDALGLKLARECGARVGGHRLRVASEVSAVDLPGADVGYAVLSDAWGATVREVCDMPDAWQRVAVGQLLDTARAVIGGQYVPKGIDARRDRDEALWNGFRGSFKEIGLQLGISEERARQIYSKRLAAERAARQPRLFADD